MKVIKAGVIRYVWPYGEWTCEDCGCIFVVEEGDPVEREPTNYTNPGDARELAYISCPTCERVQTSYGDYR